MLKKTLMLITVLTLALGITACSGDEDMEALMLEPVLQFSADRDESVKFERTKNYDGTKVREYVDSEFFYEVTADGKLKTIVVRSAPSGQNSVEASVQQIYIRAEDYLKRLGYDNTQFQTTVSFNESENQFLATSRMRSGPDFNGNNVYMSFKRDGFLVSISFKHENPEVLDNDVSLSIEEAKENLINYFRTNASTERFSESLRMDIIRHEIDVYNNKKVYNLFFTLNTEEYGLFEFRYVINTETGIILHRQEPR